MSVQKFRWSTVYESTEEELVELLKGKNLASERFEREAFSQPVSLTLNTEKTIWCAEGSFSLSLDGRSFSMQPGDAVRIPAQATVIISAGISGCAYYVTIGAGKTAAS